MPQLFGFPKTTIPGPQPLPLIGTLRNLYELLDDPVGVVLRLRRQGDVVALINQNPAVVCVFGPERNREILTKPALFRHDETLFDGPPGSAMAKLRFSIITINGDVHRRHRKLMQPAFQKSALDDYAADIVGVTRVMLDRWKTGTVSPIDTLCQEVALAMAMKCLYGLDVSAEATELGHLAAAWVQVVTAPGTIILPFDLPGTGYRSSLRLAERLTERLRALMARKRAQGGPQHDAMALLMAASADGEALLSDDELVSEAVSLFIAGHETVAMTLTWTLLLLERHPAVQASLRDEFATVLRGRDPQPDDLPRLPLLDQVIKESMRLLPAVPTLFMRVCADAASVGGFSVPKGANILISPLATHHDPQLYPEPQRFLPERWRGFAPPPYGYLPFGAGPRTCVGMLLAERALRLMLPMIIQRFRFSIPSGTRVDRLTRANIMRPRRSLPMLIEPTSAAPRSPGPISGSLLDLAAL